VLLTTVSSEFAITGDDRSAVDGHTLTEQIGLDEAEIDRRKSFTNFTDADAERLEAMEGTFDRIADDLVSEFYDHLGEYDETVSIIDSSSKGVEALQRTQTQYLRGLGHGEYDRSYFDNRARVGKIHDMLDLGPELYLGAYTIYYEGIVDAIVEDVKAEFGAGDADEARSEGASSDRARSEGEDDAETLDAALDAVAERTVSAMKLLNLDQQVAMNTYIQSYNDRVEEEAERRAEAAKKASEEIKQPVEHLTESAVEMSDRAARIRELTDDQSDKMQEVAGEVSNLSATVEEIASSADGIDAKSDEAVELAEEGRDVADDAIETMDQVGAATEDVTEDVDRLRERVGEIDEVVTMIDDIADRTNLLALNASIEAARAGNGDGSADGFAVVADEVKTLAEESSGQVARIEETVREIEAEADHTVESLEATSERIESGVEQVETALSALDDIVEAVRRVANDIDEIASATDDQAASTEEVASMVSGAAETAENIDQQVQGIVTESENQTQDIEEVEAAAAELVETIDE
jgi:heme-based aerotactic transducer